MDRFSVPAGPVSVSEADVQSHAHPTAWSHPPTRNVWMRHVVMNVVALFGWPGVWVVLICVLADAPQWVVWVFMPYFVYAPYRFCAQLAYLPRVFRMLRVLRAYPWQHLEGVPSGLGKHPGARDGGMWFEFPDPADAGKKIPLVFIKHQRTYWWMKRLNGPRTKPRHHAQIEPLWFAGDPRFLAVVAAPGRGGNAPKRMHLLYQRPAFDSSCVPESWGASPAALERARRACARVETPTAILPEDRERDALPWASQPAVQHPPTGRAIRRRVVRQMILLFAVWPTLILVPLMRVVGGDDRFIPMTARVVLLGLILVPLNVWAAATALRMHRVLSAHAWRLVECEVVGSAAHGWRLKGYGASSGQGIRVPAILRIRGTVLTATPFKRYVDSRLTHLWCAGPPGPGAVVSEPGGARPFRLTRYKGPVTASETTPATATEDPLSSPLS